MLEHFVAQTQNEIQGKARAMLLLVLGCMLCVSSGSLMILCEMKLPYFALVAFSGTLTDEETGEDYTEVSMNNLAGRISIPQALKLPQYRILIVAEKFQTGLMNHCFTPCLWIRSWEEPVRCKH